MKSNSWILSRRGSLLLLLLLPAVGYTLVVYALIGRSCREDTFFDGDYRDEKDVPHKRVVVKPNEDLFHKSREIVVAAPHVHFRKHGSTEYGSVSEFTNLAYKKPTYPFNCTNVSAIKLKKKIGHGVSKQTFLGEFPGHHVAVKMVTRHIHDVKTCLDDVRKEDAGTGAGARSRCYVSSTLKLMKEILLAEQLSHPNIAQLLGYCVRSEESDSTDIAEHGVVSVFELGSRFVLDSLQILPWPARLRHALHMADLLDYLQHSPLGSLVIPDFKEGHFVLVNSTLKLIDLDDINNVEPPCSPSPSPPSPSPSSSSLGGSDPQPSECRHGVPCQRALCVGFNAKENLKNMNRLVLKRLLFPLTFPQQVVSEVGQLNARLDMLALTAADLRQQLIRVQARALGDLSS